MEEPASHPAPRHETGDEVVRVYWRAGCMFCFALRRALRRRGIPLEEHNIWKEPEAAETVRSVAGGNETVPTVIVAGHWMVNPTASQVEELLADVAPGLLERAAQYREENPGALRRMFARG